MSFLTKPTVTKGQPSSFTLVKSQLILIPKVSSDAFFADTTNWKRVTVQYANSHGQEEILVFDASMEEPTATFSVSDRARSDYQITSIVVTDLDDGMLVISRSDLSAEIHALLDVTFETVLQTIFATWSNQGNSTNIFNEVGGVQFTTSSALNKANLENFFEPSSYADLHFKISRLASGRIRLNFSTESVVGSEVFDVVNRYTVLSTPTSLTLTRPDGSLVTFEGSTNLINPLSIEEASGHPHRFVNLVRNEGSSTATLYVNGHERATISIGSLFFLLVDASSSTAVNGQLFEILETEVTVPV